MNSLVFCPFDDHQFEAICELLCKTFHTSKTEILGFYESLRGDFDKGEWPSPVLAERSFFTAQDSRFHDTYKRASVIACDLPSLLSKGGQHTVMIIAQDSYNPNPQEKIWIGTPYALHIKKCREEMQTRRYFQLIDVLLEQGYQTYLTDFHKVYVQGAKLPRRDRQRFAEILKQEIEIIKPTAIITWGKSATNAVKGLRLDRPQYAYPHPSGAAKGAWARLIGDRATNKNILAYWRQSITQQLPLTTPMP